MKAAALLALCGTGCSLLARNGPAYTNAYGEPAPSCSTSRVAPVGDTVLSVYLAIPTAIAIAWAYDDPRWIQPADDEGGPYAGGSQVGVYLGIPSGLLLALAVTSAVYGYRAANRCEAARERAGKVRPETPHTVACRATFQAIADGGLANAPPLPAFCPRDLADDAFLLDEGGLATDTLAGAAVRLRLTGPTVTALEIVRPALSRDALGAADAVEDDVSIYLQRGIALTLDRGVAIRALVFPPTTLEGYRAHFGP